MSDPVQITVLCFAGLKEKIGASKLSFSMPANCTCANFKQRLVTAHPEAKVYSLHLLVARNGSYLNDTDIINNQDELACFPPVSGG